MRRRSTTHSYLFIHSLLNIKSNLLKLLEKKMRKRRRK
jgi:hypothetical protein